MNGDAMGGSEVAHKRIERQITPRRDPLPHPGRHAGQLATARIALFLRAKPAGLAPQLDHIVHETWRNPEVPRRLPVRITFVYERDDPLSQLHRMWLAHLMPPYLPNRQRITDQTPRES